MIRVERDQWAFAASKLVIVGATAQQNGYCEGQQNAPHLKVLSLFGLTS